MNLKNQIVRHEGLKLKPYRCTAGKLTIGVGRNLDDKGISEAEAMAMLDTDIAEVAVELERRLPLFSKLDDVRKDALINMGFNLGVPGLLKFRGMIAALELSDYDKAAAEMLDSKWAKQVGNRAGELARQMRKGEYQYA